MERRKLMAGLAAAAACAGTVPAWSAADTWPSRTITVVNPYVVGGVVDVLGRILTDRMAADLGATIVVDARPGAAGTIGTESVVRAPPDGYTWLIGTTSNASNMALMKNLRHDVLRDLVPVAQFAVSHNYFVVPATSPAKTLAEFVALAKTQPGKLNYGNTGTGATPHLGFELLKLKAGIDVMGVPYKGMPTALQDMAGGLLSAALAPAVLAQSIAPTGKYRLLAITSSTRSKSLPDVPTFQEAGYGEAALSPWFTLMVPAGTPQPVIDRIEESMRKAVASPEVAARIEAAGAQAVFRSHADTAAMVRQEVQRWRDVVKATGIQAN